MNGLIDRLNEVADDLFDELGVAATRDAEEQPHHIGSQLEKIAGQICDHYCKWPERIETEAELFENYCDHCPIMLLI